MPWEVPLPSELQVLTATSKSGAIGGDGFRARAENLRTKADARGHRLVAIRDEEVTRTSQLN